MKMFLTLVTAVLAAVLPLAQSARADFEPATWSLAALALRSELIVVGTVAKVDNSLVTVNVDTVVAGDYGGSTLTLKSYEGVGCAPGWGLYNEGQLFVWFLVKYTDDQGNPTEEFREAGGCAQGEMPVFDNVAYCDHVDIGGERQCRKEGDREIYGHTAKLDELIEAVRTLRECFTLSSDGSIEPACTDEELKRAAEKSDLLKYAIEHAEAEKSQKK